MSGTNTQTDSFAKSPAKPPLRDGRAFVALDGLRGVAAITITVLHAHYFFPSLSINANLAVDFFFALSGFVLAHAYGEPLRKSLSASRFMLIRLVRLYPLYFFGLVICLPFGMHWLALGYPASTIVINTATAVFFLPSPVTTLELYPLNPPAWSLFFELVANTCLGFFGAPSGKVTLCATMAFPALALVLGTFWFGPLIGGDTWSGFWAGAIRVSYSFQAGILTYRIWQTRKPNIRLPAPALGFLLLVLLLMQPSPFYERYFAVCAVLFLFPLLVWFGAECEPRGSIATACRWLGATSYALYILHYPMLFYAGYLAPRFLSPDASRWPWGVLFVASALAIADVGNRIDQPVRRLLYSFFAETKHSMRKFSR